jgi:hypothetical protein
LLVSSLRSSTLAQWFLVHAARQTEAEFPTMRPGCDPSSARSYTSSAQALSVGTRNKVGTPVAERAQWYFANVYAVINSNTIEKIARKTRIANLE